MDEDDKREFIEEFILDGIRNATEYIDVHYGVADWTSREDPDDTLVREIYDRIINAKVEVKFD